MFVIILRSPCCVLTVVINIRSEYGGVSVYGTVIDYDELLCLFYSDADGGLAQHSLTISIALFSTLISLTSPEIETQRACVYWKYARAHMCFNTWVVLPPSPDSCDITL